MYKKKSYSSGEEELAPKTPEKAFKA